VFAWIGAVIVGGTAWVRIAALAGPETVSREDDEAQEQPAIRA
jgi:hypothetical protein